MSEDKRAIRFLENLAVADEVFISSERVDGENRLTIELPNGMMGQGKTLYDALMGLSGNILGE